MSSSGRCDIFVFRKTWVHRVVYIFIVLFVSVLGVLGGKMAYTESKVSNDSVVCHLSFTYFPDDDRTIHPGIVVDVEAICIW